MAKMTHQELLAKRAGMPKFDAYENARSIRETGRDLRGMRAYVAKREEKSATTREP